MYENIKMQIKIAEENKQYLLIMGDFNAKVGNLIEGNNEEISTAGKLLRDMILVKTNCTIVNASEKTKGKWTRTEGTKKSILDYMIINKEHHQSINQMIIDEEKVWGLYRINGNNETVYTDHNAILAEMNWYDTSKTSKIEDRAYQMIISKTNLQRFKSQTERGELIKTSKNPKDIQTVYNEWENQVKEIIDKCFKKKKRINKYKGKNRKGRLLMKTKREIRKIIAKNNVNEDEENILRIRDRLINELLNKQTKESLKKKISKVAEVINKSKGINRTAFWQFKNKMTKKTKESKTTMKDKNGKIEENSEKIMEIFESFYTDLFKTSKARSHQEEIAEKEVESLFKQYEMIARNTKHKAVTTEELKSTIKQLKRKKAGDTKMFKNEMLQWGGRDLIESIKNTFNKIMKEQEIPESWNNMIVKSIYKKKGDRAEMKNRRGLFLTNIISKLFEKVLANRNRERIEQSISPNQCGGIKNRGTVDHLFTMRAIIDYYRSINKELYIFFGDLEKCFDKLWLKDCMIELWRTKIPANEAYLVYLMNKHSNIQIDTPMGMTNAIEVHEIVRQGTVFGPMLCGIVTYKINNFAVSVTEQVGTRTNIGTLMFVDDICGTGSKMNIERTIKNCRAAESKKKMTFNPEKSNYIRISFKRSKSAIKNEIEEK
eukprot:Seg92.1 transcript_id=Seg92.1/GoldUCD/mRNA.D3Y31 product="LINE-1 retrotransposable element ORF2 protein" pseudo=true protein_id=Seg92.1/GoldUCD/D3Y31